MIAVIILAAGKSQRMGPINKLTQDLGGQPLAHYAIDAALGSKARPALIVEGNAHTAAHRPHLEHIYAPDAHKGQAHSLRAGINALADKASVTGALITLADMPFITSALINLIYDAASQSPSKIVRPFVGGKPGHPVYWPRRYFKALLGINGDSGAQPIIRQAGAQLERIDVNDDAISFDVDTPEALEAARQRLIAIDEPLL